jgi:hypothetical protein
MKWSTELHGLQIAATIIAFWWIVIAGFAWWNPWLFPGPGLDADLILSVSVIAAVLGLISAGVGMHIWKGGEYDMELTHNKTRHDQWREYNRKRAKNWVFANFLVFTAAAMFVIISMPFLGYHWEWVLLAAGCTFIVLLWIVCSSAHRNWHHQLQKYSNEEEARLRSMAVAGTPSGSAPEYQLLPAKLRVR